jgi:hypothetical protein
MAPLSAFIKDMMDRPSRDKTVIFPIKKPVHNSLGSFRSSFRSPAGQLSQSRGYGGYGRGSGYGGYGGGQGGYWTQGYGYNQGGFRGRGAPEAEEVMVVEEDQVGGLGS